MNLPKYKRSENALFAEIADDIVALNIDQGQSYGMEDVTAAVWRLLAEPTDLHDICTTLMEQYQVEAHVCHAEVAHLLAQFESEGLIHQVEGSAHS